MMTFDSTGELRLEDGFASRRIHDRFLADVLSGSLMATSDALHEDLDSGRIWQTLGQGVAFTVGLSMMNRGGGLIKLAGQGLSVWMGATYTADTFKMIGNVWQMRDAAMKPGADYSHKVRDAQHSIGLFASEALVGSVAGMGTHLADRIGTPIVQKHGPDVMNKITSHMYNASDWAATQLFGPKREHAFNGASVRAWEGFQCADKTANVNFMTAHDKGKGGGQQKNWKDQLREIRDGALRNQEEINREIEQISYKEDPNYKDPDVFIEAKYDNGHLRSAYSGEAPKDLKVDNLKTQRLLEKRAAKRGGISEPCLSGGERSKLFLDELRSKSKSQEADTLLAALAELGDGIGGKKPIPEKPLPEKPMPESGDRQNKFDSKPKFEKRKYSQKEIDEKVDELKKVNPIVADALEAAGEHDRIVFFTNSKWGDARRLRSLNATTGEKKDVSVFRSELMDDRAPMDLLKEHAHGFAILGAKVGPDGKFIKRDNGKPDTHVIALDGAFPPEVRVGASFRDVTNTRPQAIVDPRSVVEKPVVDEGDSTGNYLDPYSDPCLEQTSESPKSVKKEVAKQEAAKQEAAKKESIKETVKDFVDDASAIEVAALNPREKRVIAPEAHEAISIEAVQNLERWKTKPDEFKSDRKPNFDDGWDAMVHAAFNLSSHSRQKFANGKVADAEVWAEALVKLVTVDNDTINRFDLADKARAFSWLGELQRFDKRKATQAESSLKAALGYLDDAPILKGGAFEAQLLESYGKLLRSLGKSRLAEAKGFEARREFILEKMATNKSAFKDAGVWTKENTLSFDPIKPERSAAKNANNLKLSFQILQCFGIKF